MQNVAPQPTPSPPIRGVVVPGLEGTPAISIPVPRTAADLDALRARRSELSDQLQSVDGRRSKLLSQLQKLRDETAIQGLEGRLALLDKRQLQLESDLQQTGQALSSPAKSYRRSSQRGVHLSVAW